MRTLAAFLATLAASSVALAREPSRLAPADAPSTAAVASAAEPGPRLSVTGVVYAADGRTPVPRASVYVYQTDARGFYRPDDAMGNRDPRLKALMRRIAASAALGFRGDRVPDFRLVDYPVSLLSTDESPALDGRLGNTERLKKDLESQITRLDRILRAAKACRAPKARAQQSKGCSAPTDESE